MIGEAQNATTPSLSPPSPPVAPVRVIAPTRQEDPNAQPVAPTVLAISPASVANEPVSFPVSLQFDQDTHQFIIEARDRVSGFVVFQVPFKAAISAGNSATPGNTRGSRVNREA